MMNNSLSEKESELLKVYSALAGIHNCHSFLFAIFFVTDSSDFEGEHNIKYNNFILYLIF